MAGADHHHRHALADFADTPPADLPLRAQAALAQMALNAAQVAQSPDLRQLYADRANTLVSQLRQSAPHATPTLILGAQWELQQHPFGADCTLTDTAPRALSDYAESYHTAPFLWREARWRIALGSLCWANLATTTRAHMIDEATWLTRFDGALRPEVEDLLGDSPAAVQYQLHMVEKSADAEGENGF